MEEFLTGTRALRTRALVRHARDRDVRSVPGGAAAPEDWVDDVTAVMDAAGFERATLVAQGHAAQMALMAAATHRERIDVTRALQRLRPLARDDDYPAGMPEARRASCST